MRDSKSNYTTAADVFDGWRDDVLSGSPPTFYPVASAGALARIEIGPGLVTLFGGAPGAVPLPGVPNTHPPPRNWGSVVPYD